MNLQSRFRETDSQYSVNDMLPREMPKLIEITKKIRVFHV